MHVHKGISNIAVFGDGTWCKRGYKSSTGVVAVISLMTGEIFNCDIMSKECRTCFLNTADYKKALMSTINGGRIIKTNAMPIRLAHQNP